MIYRRNNEPLPQDGIYRAILLLMIANVVIGVGLMLLGGELWDSPAISRAGFWLAIVSALLYLFFRWLGRREVRRRREAEGQSHKR
ncbi:MAG TPA: hypothetical protein VK035_03585 [Kiloniellales bacterium]|nr:hypothetical protein [Kiloniellales bacterium]